MYVHEIFKFKQINEKHVSVQCVKLMVKRTNTNKFLSSALAHVQMKIVKMQ